MVASHVEKGSGARENRSSGVAVWWPLLLAALALRLVWAWVAAAEPEMLADPMRYLGAARFLAEGRGYRDAVTGALSAYYPPGYPFFLGGIGRLLAGFGALDHLIVAALVVQCFLGVAVACLWARLGANLWGEETGRVALPVLALYPNLVFHSGVLLSETLFLAVFGLALLTLFPREGEQPLGWGRLAAHGLLLGLAILIRPQGSLYLAPVAVLWWWRQGTRPAVLRLVATVAVALVVVAPWSWRNFGVFEAFVPISTNNGDNLCVGYNAEATGGFLVTEECATGISVFGGSQAELARDRAAAARARAWARAHPEALPRLVLRRLATTLGSDHDALATAEEFGTNPWLPDLLRSVLVLACDAAWWVVLVGAGVSAVTVLATPSQFAFLAAGAMSLVPVALVFGDPRFKMPLVPVLIIVAAAGVVRRRSGRRPMIAGASG